MEVFKNFLILKFKRDIIRTKIWFPSGKRWLANNMTGRVDTRLCKLESGWRLVKWMYQVLLSSLSSQRSNNNNNKRNNAWSQVRMAPKVIICQTYSWQRTLWCDVISCALPVLTLNSSATGMVILSNDTNMPAPGVHLKYLWHLKTPSVVPRLRKRGSWQTNNTGTFNPLDINFWVSSRLTHNNIDITDTIRHS